METVYYLNGVSSLFSACGLAYIVLSQKIREGLIIKLGLVAMIGGLLMTSYFTLSGIESMQGLWNAGLLLRVGLCVVIAGYWWKRYRIGHACMRSTDWLLDEEIR